VVGLLSSTGEKVVYFLLIDVFESFLKGLPNRHVQRAVFRGAFVALMAFAEEAHRIRSRLGLGSVFPRGEFSLDKLLKVGW
jgi:hypothetical protein